MGTEPEKIDFRGKVAVITGAGAGLGKVYALELAKLGAKVLVNDVGRALDGSGDASPKQADRVVEEILALGGEALANYDSVATAVGGRSIVSMAVESFGRLDIVINNAGILRDRTLVKMEPDDWSDVINVHLAGAYNVTRPAFVKMREIGYGRIVFATSAAGLYGTFGQSNYSAAKMGLVGFMNTLKLEGEKHNIKVNAVAPIAGTRMTKDILPIDLFARLKPEFISPLVLYLCSEKCPVSGSVYNAGMGYFNRVAIVTGPGMIVGGGAKVPSLEDIHEHWEGINDMSNGKEFPNASMAFGSMMVDFNRK